MRIWQLASFTLALHSRGGAFPAALAALTVAACSTNGAVPGQAGASIGAATSAIAAGAPAGTVDCAAASGSSALWQDFVAARRDGREPILPDYSYAGYHYSTRPLPEVNADRARKRFVVTAFGALPGDDGYDDAGIQAAIDAAGQAGGGVVFFPAGRYRVSPSEDADAVIRVRASHVVLKGAGSGDGGTEIFVDKMKKAFMFRVEPPRAPRPAGANTPAGPGRNNQALARVTADARRESFALEVDDTSKLRPGQWLTVSGGGPQYNQAYWGDLWPMPESWERMHRSGNQFAELHRVVAIEGRVVRFAEPLHLPVKVSTGAPFTLRPATLLEEVGIEDIRFTGNWSSYPETFVHHKDAIHDTGWSGLAIERVANGWVRRCEFRDFNQSLHIGGSAAFTFEGLRFTGKKGHTSLHTRRGYGMLAKDNQEVAGHHHGPGLGYWGSGTVYLRHRMLPAQSMDSHSGSPYATLFDGVQGGVLSGNGGPLPGLPHHGPHLVFWNFAHRAPGAKQYDFWSTSKRINNTFARPRFAGFTSVAPVSFVDEKSKVSGNESFGRPVTPRSLFEAQLALRRCTSDGADTRVARGRKSLHR